MAPYNGLIKKGWNVLKQSSLSQQVCRVRLIRVQAILGVVDYILVAVVCFSSSEPMLSPYQRLVITLS